MDAMVKKTHTERKSPQITVRYLADYMDASEQSRRRIIRDCKYRPVARVIQHKDARRIITKFLSESKPNLDNLRKDLEILKSKLCTDHFEEEVKKHNCDYVSRFISLWMLSEFDLPNFTYSKAHGQKAVNLRGTLVSLDPQLLVTRTTKTNKQLSGALCLRYAKGKPLKDEVGRHQSALTFGILKRSPIMDGTEPDKALCLTLDAYAGNLYSAPTNSTYLFKEMEAVCEGIAERWPEIKPPVGAIL
jgi:hypothetical protein